MRPTWLDVKIIKGSVWEEERDNGERYREGEGRAEEEKRHRTRRVNTHLMTVICLYLLAHDTMIRTAPEIVLAQHVASSDNFA